MANLLDKQNIAKASPPGGITIGTTTVTGGTTGSVLFVGASSKVQQDNTNFFWDDTNNQLQLNATGSSAGLRLGGDVLLYRTAADLLRTPDSFQLDARMSINDAPSSTRRLYIYNGTASDTGLYSYSDAASTISGHFINAGTGTNFGLLVNSFGGSNNYALFISNGDIGFSTGTGTKIGEDNTMKFAFWGATPIAQPANTTSVNTLLVNTGLIASGGQSTFTNRIEENQGADVASANNLSLGTDGNTFEITGTTQINLISNVSWQNGSKVTLLFTSNPTVKHNQATSTTNITIQLAGAADFVASAGDTLTLVLSEIGGTQAWREISRAVI